MKTKTKIIVVGIGGVGGYFGGILAKHFEGHTDVEIYFYARGAHLYEIQKKGLKVIQGHSEFVAQPYLATDKSYEIGIADYILLATKSYDVENILVSLRPCIDKKTVILPLLNGLEHKDIIKKFLPQQMVLDGCVYIVSRLVQSGMVANTGNVQKLYFGLDRAMDEHCLRLENIFKQAKMDAIFSDQISTIIWEKFIFLSPLATATSYYDKCIGDLIGDTNSLHGLIALIEEVKQVAFAKSIQIPVNITALTMDKIKNLPLTTTTSMHDDIILRKANTELESLTGYVQKAGTYHNIPTPTYSKMYAYLSHKITTHR